MNDDWWPVALSDALEPGQVLAVPLHGREHVLWRDAAGGLHAHDDRCPHRGMRLSYGFVRDARLACAYHGWQFDGRGQCRALPAHPAVTPATTMAVRPHPVAMVDGLIWLRAPAPDTAIDGRPGEPQPAGATDGPEPRADWPEGWSAAPVRSRYLRADVAQVDAALRALDLGTPPGARPDRPGDAPARTDAVLLADGERGLGWGLQPAGHGRMGVHVVALARGPAVTAAWRLAISRALRALPFDA